MESRVELTDNKHIYARVEGDVFVVRVPRWVPEKERDRIVERMLQKMERRYQGAGVFTQARQAGEVLWAWGEKQSLPGDVCALPDKAFRRYLLEEARKQWLDQIRAELRGFAVQMRGRRALAQVSIKDLQSRWGSCSPTGDISVSLATLLLPYPLFAYVCAHEVAHLQHLNHSSAFWSHLQMTMPDALQRRRLLHSHHIS